MRDIAKALAQFAAEHPALGTTTTFPRAEWRALGQRGLTGVAIPPAWGGQGATYAETARGAEALARATGSLGFAMLWLGQQRLARTLFHDLADDAQRREWLPQVVEGEAIAALAISEPGRGAHPKHLSTRAAIDGADVVITGEKAFITNADVASLFVVLAVDAIENGRKRFSAYLVPRGTARLGIEAEPGLEAFRPLAHGRLRLDGCRVPLSARIGPKGQAFETISLPYRDIEDVTIMGPILGILRRAAADLASRAPASPEARGALGEIAALLTALDDIARVALDGLDRGLAGEPAFPAHAIAFRALTTRVEERVAAARQVWNIGPAPEIDRLMQCAAAAGKIARGALALKQERLAATLGADISAT
ncbi:MAG: acyl-CoA dehydrogenase family protein [Alphaproteobacteria bacterium]